MWSSLVVCVVAVSAASASAASLDSGDAKDDVSLYTLPDGFLLGSGTSSYQTEGAWNVDGKGVNVMDHGLHAMGLYAGDIACDSYLRYKEDIALAASLKMNVFRMSISWSRVFPHGYADPKYRNEVGVQHYHDVIDELLKHNITPMVTISHFDYPQALQDDFGGWLSEKMVDAFADFADFLFQEYGHKVKLWLSLNEINMHCMLVYGAGSPTGFLPPGNKTTSTIDNLHRCVHNELLGHSAAYRRYRDKYKQTQQGVVGVGILASSFRANTADLADIYTAERLHVSGLGLILYPLVYGDYPEVIKARTPSLPQFTDEQKQLLRGTVDFAGVNAYFGLNVTAGNVTVFEPEPPAPGQPVPPGGTGLPGVIPIGMGDPGAYWILGSIAMWMNTHFGDRVKLFFTENGEGGTLGDGIEAIHDWDSRGVSNVKYLRDLVYTINKNNLTNVMGYMAWSFMDDTEFDRGINYCGIVQVDFDGGSLNRKIKHSAQVYNFTMTSRVVPKVEDIAPDLPSPTSALPSSASAVSAPQTAALLGVALLYSTVFALLRPK